MMAATICERQEIRGQAGVPPRDGAGSSTVRRRVAATKREKFAVKGRTRRTRLPRTMRSSHVALPPKRWDPRLVDDLSEGKDGRDDHLEVLKTERDADDRDAENEPAEEMQERNLPPANENPDDIHQYGKTAGLARAVDDLVTEGPECVCAQHE